jgi:hypothetical protein
MLLCCVLLPPEVVDLLSHIVVFVYAIFGVPAAVDISDMVGVPFCFSTHAVVGVLMMRRSYCC